MSEFQADHPEYSRMWDAYRAACPEIDPSADFMPRLWQKIDSRRTFSMRVRVLARGFATAAAGLCLLFSALSLTVGSSNSLPAGVTYVDILAADHSADRPFGLLEDGDLR